jgi:hypothetical protein
MDDPKVPADGNPAKAQDARGDRGVFLDVDYAKFERRILADLRAAGQPVGYNAKFDYAALYGQMKKKPIGGPRPVCANCGHEARDHLGKTKCLFNPLTQWKPKDAD